MSTQPLIQNSTAVQAHALGSAQAGLGARNLAWIAALCILAVGPGTIGYTRSLELGEPLIVALFVLSIARREFRRSPLDPIAVVWLGSQFAATIWGYRTGWGSHSPYPSDLYSGGFFGPLRLLIDTTASLMAAYAMVWRSGSGDARIAPQRIAPVLAAAGCVLLLCAIEQIRNMIYGTSDPRIQATFTNPNLLGAFICIALPAAAAIAISRERSRAGRIAAGALAGLLAAALILTQSRGAFLGCAIGLIYIGAAAWAQRAHSDVDRSLRGQKAAWAIAVCCVLTVASSLLIFPHVLHQSRGVSDDQRRTAWLAATIVIRSQPLTGIGSDGFPAAIAALRLRELNPETRTGLPLVPAMHLHAHDLLLQAWVERGLIGAISVVALVLLVLRKARKTLGASAARFDPIAAGAIGALLATLAQNVTDYTFWYAPIAILFWMTAGLVFASE